ncbi:hypothetical protein D046_3237B, partial [Vibrio parahaemolyticus V-223/04]
PWMNLGPLGLLA